MELEKEFIEKNGLSEDQVKAITEVASATLAEAQKAMEDKFKGEANTNAENIISGAAALVEKETGIKRSEGEKYADYLKRSGSEFTKGKSVEIDKLKADYTKKLAEFQGGDALKSELDTTKAKLDEALQKYADYDEVKAKAEKADEYDQQLSGLKLEVAFGKVKPTFPDTVNPFEAKAKWDEFQKGVLEKNTIEIVDGEAVAIDKENKFKQTKLAELVAKDESLSELTKGRQQIGTGAKPVKKVTIEGVPFEVPEGATTAAKAILIREYLTKNGTDIMDPTYAQKFAELNAKMK